MVGGDESILAKLKGGDRRSIGKSGEAAMDVSKDPAQFADLFAGLLDEGRLVRMPAADAIDKVTRDRPELPQPWTLELLGTVSTLEDKEMRWHVAQMLPRLKLTPSEQKVVLRILMGYLRTAAAS